MYTESESCRYLCFIIIRITQFHFQLGTKYLAVIVVYIKYFAKTETLFSH
jgi:hypothetical protein